MTRRFLFAVAALALVGGSGCKKDAEAKYAELNLDASVGAFKDGATFFDVNTEDFRKANGKVPGAVLLTSSSQYDLSVLPPQKATQLVFYCTSPI